MKPQLDTHLWLECILRSLDKIERSTKGLGKNKFTKNVIIQDALVWNIGVIEEAAKKIPPHIKKKAINIPWKELGRMKKEVLRDNVHVDADKSWSVKEELLKNLRSKIQQLLNETTISIKQLTTINEHKINHKS